MALEYTKFTTLGEMSMFQYEETLEYDIERENYIKDLQELFKTLRSYNGQSWLSKVPQTENKYCLSCEGYETWQKEPVLVRISAEYDVKCLHKIKVEAIPDPNDLSNYENDLKLFYLEHIKGALLDTVNRKSDACSIAYALLELSKNVNVVVNCFYK